MAREFRNVSGQTLAVSDARGMWRTVKDGEIVMVADEDRRDWPTSDTGEASPVWEEITKAGKANKGKESS